VDFITASAQYPNDPNHASALLVLIAALMVVGIAAAAIRVILATGRTVEEPPIDGVRGPLAPVVAPVEFPRTLDDLAHHANQYDVNMYGRHAGTNTGTFTVVRHKMNLG
jgi:hypothetical protein